ncbi:MAG: phosphotransferase [Armatimonadetes bacterium]|nr:phosphotransferase [Armatimonadota bacterium]MBS1728140.1 phosphotransferase [Armatimonadota bacterium]
MLTDRAVIEGRPSHFTGAYEDYTTADIVWVVEQFQVQGDIEVAPFPGRGNINLHTYEVVAGGREYLLQKVNTDVFALPYRVMDGMSASIQAQRESLDKIRIDGWVPIDLVPTHHGKTFLDLTDEHGWSVWRMMDRIPDSITYKSLSEVDCREEQLRLASEVGRGLAIYSDLTSCIKPHSIEGSLPGYRDTGLYYRQFHSVIAGNRSLGDAAALLPDDPILRTSMGPHFLVAIPEEEYQARLNDPELAPYIALVQEQEPFAMALWTAVAQGRIRHTLIHGDTKIENFLFDSNTGNVKALVDLDTIMPFTWLADWGDMLRSLVNVAGEKETDLSKVKVDEDVYKAVAEGFLLAATEITDQEVSMMVPAVQAIALELGLRFLTDYLKGDTYFKLGDGDPKTLNKTRAMVQLTLYRRLVEFGPEAEGFIRSLR